MTVALSADGGRSADGKHFADCDNQTGGDNPANGGNPPGVNNPANGSDPTGGNNPTNGSDPPSGNNLANGGNPPGGNNPTNGSDPTGGNNPTNGSDPPTGNNLANGGNPPGGNNPTNGSDPPSGDNPTNGGDPTGGDNPANRSNPPGGNNPANGGTVADGENPAAAAFFRSALMAFAGARQRDEAGQLWLRIARRTVHVCFAGARTAEAIAPAFEHVVAAPQQTADLTILLWDTVSTGVEPPSIPWRPGDLDRIGKVRGGCDARFTTVHEPDTGQFWMFDRQSATAVVWMNDVDAVPLWDRIHPFRRLLHVWARGFGADLVHAGAVGVDGVGVLVVGPGGTGKSTTVLAAMQAGLLSAGDDYVLVDTELPSGSPPAAHALYGTMRLHQTHLDRFPALMARHDHVFQEPWSGRAKVTSYMSRHHPDGLTAELRLTAIVIPQVVADTTGEVARETAVRALLALAPSSMLQVDPTDGGMFPRLTRLCRVLPCWRLLLGPDLAQVGVMLRRLIEARQPVG